MLVLFLPFPLCLCRARRPAPSPPSKRERDEPSPLPTSTTRSSLVLSLFLSLCLTFYLPRPSGDINDDGHAGISLPPAPLSAAPRLPTRSLVVLPADEISPPASSAYGVPPPPLPPSLSRVLPLGLRATRGHPPPPPTLPSLCCRPPFLGQRDVILERFVRVLYIRLSAVPCRRHIPYLRRVPLRQRRRVRRPQSRLGA